MSRRDAAVADAAPDADAAAPECVGDEGCDHLDGVCVAGRCDGGECRAEPLHDTPCDDGLRCTTDDRCHQGACQGAPRDCGDDAECTVDRCDEATGQCLHDASACECDEDSECDNGMLCDGVETCDLTTLSCQPGAAAEDDTPCADGLICTAGDVCVGGVCVGTPLDCEDGLSCTENVCSEEIGACVITSNTCACQSDGQCNNGTLCDGVETCDRDGQCQPGIPVSCPPSTDPCQVNTCQASTGLCALEAAMDDTPCSDGDACTVTDVCHAGQCLGSGLPDDSAGDWTVVSASAIGAAVHGLAADGAGGLWALLDYNDTLSLGPTAGGGELHLDNDSATWPRAYAVAHYGEDGTLTSLRRVARDAQLASPFNPVGQIAAAGDGGFTISWRHLRAQDQLGAGTASITLTDETLGLFDAVVAHYTPAGTYSWHRVARGTGWSWLDSGPTGTALLTVVHSSTRPLKLEVPGQVTTVISEAGISIVEYDVAGTLVSAKRVLNRADYGVGFCSVTVEGRVLCWGLFQSGSPTGGSPAVGLELASGAGGSLYTQGHNDGFIALDAPAGGASWLRGVGTAGSDGTSSCVVVGDRVACLTLAGGVVDDAPAVVYDPSGPRHTFPPIHTTADSQAMLLTFFDLDGQLVAGVRHEAVESPAFRSLVATDSSLFAYGSGGTGDRWWGSARLPTSTEARSGLVAEIDVDDGQLLWATIAGESKGSLEPSLLAPTTSAPGLTLGGYTTGAYTIGAVSGDTDRAQLFLTRLNSAGGAACQ